MTCVMRRLVEISAPCPSRCTRCGSGHLVERKGGGGKSKLDDRVSWLIVLALLLKLLSLNL